MMRRSWWIIAIYISAISLPYLFVWLVTPTDQVFGGFLLNPMDGNSYLAKMQQGFVGKWLFTLPYSAYPGAPEFLFIFYILLGHSSRWLGLPVIFVFHICRILCAFYFAVTLRKFLHEVLSPYIRPFPDWVLMIVLFGSGSGWLLLASGHITTDFWVAEAYPFLSGFVNPHFPLGIALMLKIIMDWSYRTGRYWWAKQALQGIALALVMPFGILILTVILGLATLLEWYKKRKLDVWGLIAPIGLGGLILLYQYSITITHPQLANWNLQNQTATPPVWDVIVSFSPVFLVIVLGFKSLKKMEVSRILLVCIVWAVICRPLAYVPFNLQRRLLTGFFIPLVCMLPLILGEVASAIKINVNRLRTLIIAFSLITNGFIIIIAGGFSIVAMDPLLFLPRSDYQGLEWIKANAKVEDVILADTNLSVFIPAITGRRVVYGHPFESIDANNVRVEVEDLFTGRATGSMDVIEKYSIDFVLVRRAELNSLHFQEEVDLNLAYENGSIIIYRVINQLQ
jgi:hypothetical protein